MQISPSPAFSVWNFTTQEAQVGRNHIMKPVFLLGKIAETCTFYAGINPKIQINLLESMQQYCRGENNNVSANQMSKRPYVSKDQHEKQNDSFSAASEWILRKLDWTQDLNILNQACVFWPIHQQRWPPLPLINWLIFLLLLCKWTKRYRKQDPNVLCNT